MKLFRKVLTLSVGLAIPMLYGCSEEEKGNLPSYENKVPDVPVVALQLPDKQTKKEEIDEERPLKIGVIGPESGGEASYGLSVLKGALAAAARFNAQGGIADREIEVLHYDTKDEPGLTIQAVKELTRQRVIAILSAPTGWSTFAPTHLVNNSRTIFISIGTRRRIGRSGPYVFRAALPDEVATSELIKYASEELGYADYAIVTSSVYDYSLDVSALFKQAVLKHNGELKVDVDTYDSYSGKTNMGNVINAIKGSADTLHGVIFTGGISECILLGVEMKKAGLDLPIIGGEDLFSADYLKGGDAVLGSLLYATYSPHNGSSKVSEFIHDYGKDNPDRFAALAYDSFLMLTEAIKTAGSTKTSKVKEALVTLRDFEGATGKTRFTMEGVPVKHPFIYSIKNTGDGERFVLIEVTPARLPPLSGSNFRYISID